MTQPAPPLSYDTAVGRPNRWLRRGLLWLGIAIAIGFGSVWIGPLWRQTQLLYWQHKCMVHEPSGQKNPKEFDRYMELASPPGIRSQGTLFLHELTSPAGHRRMVSVQLRWQNWIWPDPNQTGHTMKFTASEFGLDVWVIDPSTSPLRQPTIVSREYSILIKELLQPIALDTGRADPTDHSHFLLTIENGGWIVEGWLRDDDKIRFETRKAK